jgi:hypothetical protein
MHHFTSPVPAASFCSSSNVYHGKSSLSAPQVSCYIDWTFQLAWISDRTCESVSDCQRTHSVSFCQSCYMYSPVIAGGNRGKSQYAASMLLPTRIVQRVKKNKEDLRELAESIVDILSTIHDIIAHGKCALGFSDTCTDFNE